MACLIVGTALAQQRETARMHITRGQELMKEQNYAEAVNSFEAARRLEPRNRQAETLLRDAQEKRTEQTFNLAQGLHQAGNYTEAIVQYSAALRFMPPGYNKGSAISGRLNEAQRALQEQQQQAQEQSARERSESARQAIQKANEHFLSGKYAEAVAEYENASEIGGLSAAETTEIQRLIAEAKDFSSKAESLSRPLKDEDFDVLQNRDNTITITKYKAVEKKTVNIDGTNHSVSFGILNVVIPNTIYGLRPTIIGAGAFKDTGITSVVLPPTITEIGPGAFAGNRLESVTFGPNLVAIKGGAAQGQIETTEVGAFEGNPGLTHIVIPNNVTEIGARAFKDCGLISVMLGNRVHTIGESAFRNNKLEVITFPVSVRRVHRFAFNGNQLRTVQLNNGMELVYEGVFTDNPMTSAILPATLAGLIRLDGRDCPRIGGDHHQFKAFVPSFPDTLERITLPANMHADNLKSFHEGLVNMYEGQRRVAGTYIKNGPVWVRHN